MINDPTTKVRVTVTEMARMCGLSRARFYQLLAEGVFPAPSRNQATGRPFYDTEQQNACLQVKRTNQGVNGKPIIFYGLRAVRIPNSPAKRKPLPISRSLTRKRNPDPLLEELRHGLKQLGVDGLDDLKIRTALAHEFPDGHSDIATSDVLRSVFVFLQQTKDAG